MAKKKRKKKKLTKKQLFQKRSRASKKGWKSRRANEVLRKGMRGKVPEPKPTRDVETILAGMSGRDIALAATDAPPAVREFLEGWVSMHDPDQMHRNGTIASQRSSLRHLGSETDELTVRLEVAAVRGGFDREAHKIADEQGVPVQEVYTLWFSP